MFRKIFFLLTLSVVVTAQETINFEDFFTDKTLRIDYFHTGDAKTELITFDQLYEQGSWAGSLKNLTDNFNNGRYYVKIYDEATNKLIYSKGFDSYFGEYQTSEWGIAGIKKSYHESVLIPYPKKNIKFSFESRNREKKLSEIFFQVIDPNNVMVIRDKVLDNDVIIVNAVNNGDPHKKVDIVILGEGYAKNDVEKFNSDLKKFTDVHFSHEPYKSNKSKFNIYGVLKPSQESGVDEPDHASFKKTSLNATFNSLGSERYLLTEDNKTMRDIAAHVPYDAIYIMVNHKRYGGGGIYNLYCTFTTDNQWYAYLFLHEFGHSFAGLADEYYTSATAYNEFYPKGIEPVEPNITALLNPSELKWKELITSGIKIPTPWEKENYDSSDYAYQRLRQQLNTQIADMKKNGIPQNEIAVVEEEAERLSREHAEAADEYLRKSKFWNKVGAFEGAGYSSQGLYRSMLDCLMFSKGDKPFCKVCGAAVERVIRHYAE